jgi:UDP-N-acetylmuramoyl-tripeptide--D-alanyl-D-alanine ligase
VHAGLCAAPHSAGIAQPLNTNLRELSALTDDLLFIVLIAAFLAAAFLLALRNVRVFSKNQYQSAAQKQWVRDNILELVLKTGWIFGTVPLILEYGSWGMGAACAIYAAVALIHLPGKAGRADPYTAREKRLFYTQIALMLLIAILPFVLPDSRRFFVMVFALASIASPYLVLLSHTINKPFERVYQNKALREAEEALKKMPDLKVVCVSGENGMSGFLWILETLIREKHPALTVRCAGLQEAADAVGEALKKDCQVLICGLDLNNAEEVKRICALVRPAVGIVRIFGQSPKGSGEEQAAVDACGTALIRALQADGTAVLPMEAKTDQILPKNVLRYGIGPAAGEAIASDVSVSGSGTAFRIGQIRFITKLLSRQNITDLAAALAAARALDIAPEELRAAVGALESVPDRLCLSGSGNTLFIRNACRNDYESALSARETLSEFRGHTLLGTAGIDGTGPIRDQENFQLGLRAAEGCDRVVLINTAAALSLFNGLLAAGYPRGQISFAKSLREGVLTAEGIDTHGKVRIILVENDLSKEI